MSISHDELAKQGGIYVQQHYDAWPVLDEIPSMGRGGGETPDRIAWSRRGEAIVVEAKASRADFQADMKKPHRYRPQDGLGRYRLYVCEPEVIQPYHAEEHGWGLLYYDGQNYNLVVEPPRWLYHDCDGEQRILLSHIRSLSGNNGTARRRASDSYKLTEAEKAKVYEVLNRHPEATARDIKKQGQLNRPIAQLIKALDNLPDVEGATHGGVTLWRLTAGE